MILASMPKVVTKAFPSFIWRFPEEEKILYLTFDDGPIPETTPWVLSVLNDFNAKATFFCVGENVNKYTYLYDKLLNEGHSVGNHTFNHLNGWRTEPEAYTQNIKKAENYIQSNLFRPPHGLIKKSQFQSIREDYKVIMWDVLSMDYDKKITQEQCLKNVTNNAKPGSIVVFHDSIKAWDNLQYALPRALKHFSDLGYQFAAINLNQYSLPKPSLIEWWINYSIIKKRA